MRSYMRYLEGHQVWRYIYDMVTLRLQTVFCPVQKVSWDDKLNLFDISVSYEIFLTLCYVLCTLLSLARAVLLCWPLIGTHLKWPWSLDLIMCIFCLFVWFLFAGFRFISMTTVLVDRPLMYNRLRGSLRFGLINLALCIATNET